MNYANSNVQKTYDQQDILFALSKNNSEEEEEVYNDVIAISDINIPHKNHKISQYYNQYYSCVDSHKISHFAGTKNIVVHPGQITFFEYKQVNFGRSLLVTSNHDINEIFLWDMYNKRNMEDVDERESDDPDYTLLAPDSFEIDNIRWANKSLKLYTTMTEEVKRKEHLLCIYDLKDTQVSSGHEAKEGEPSRMSKHKKAKSLSKPEQTIKIPININYLCLDDRDENRIFGTSDNDKFILDIRNPYDFLYFTNGRRRDDPLNLFRQKNDVSTDLMVEYNQNNHAIFVDRAEKEIYIYDIRKPDNYILTINLESKIRKLEINPFNPNELVAVFRSYMIKVDFSKVDYDSVFFGNKKMIDFNFSQTNRNEFLLSGDIYNEDNHYFAGFLNVCRLK